MLSWKWRPICSERFLTVLFHSFEYSQVIKIFKLNLACLTEHFHLDHLSILLPTAFPC